MRNQNCLCSSLIVFIATNQFKKELPQYSNSASLSFSIPSDYTPDLISKAHTLLTKIYKEGYQYKRAGIMLAELVYQKDKQYDLFENRENSDKKTKFIKAIDVINRNSNDEIVRPLAYNLNNNWQMRRVFKSPNYTTCLSDIPLVKAR